METPYERVAGDGSHRWKAIVLSDLGILILLALAKLILHTLTNTQYGFHRDELVMLDNARYLAWGYVEYPPLTPFVGRVALALFGSSLPGVRFFAALSQSIVMVLTGLMAREMGGRRPAQFIAALAAAFATGSFIASTLFVYEAFDLMWWVLVAYLAVRLAKSDDPRWWLGIGAAIGLGMMTRYTMAFCVAGIVAGVLLTGARRHLASPWLWGGVALSLLIFLPNAVWQAQHGFISLEFLSSIHARDIRIGRTQGFWLDQLSLSANPFTIPIWLAGLYFLFLSAAGRRYRMLGWMAVVPIALFAVSQGRGYYTAPAYPILLAAGAVAWERWLLASSPIRARLGQLVTGVLLAAGLGLVVLIGPYAPINSGWWEVSSKLNGDLKEEIGWPELVRTVAGIYAGIPAAEKARAGILTGNYGEAGAIDLYGRAYGLPRAISGANSYWLRGYGDPPPETVIVVGYTLSTAQRVFGRCEQAGRNTNPYGVENEESVDHPIIYLCRGPRAPWLEMWKDLRSFG